MNEYIEVIGQLKPKNNASFALADVNDLRGGYIQVTNMSDMEAFLNTNKLKEGMLCYVKIHLTATICTNSITGCGTYGKYKEVEEVEEEECLL